MILPSVDRSFAWRTLPQGPTLASPLLEPYATHFFTTRPWKLGIQAPRLDSDPWREVAAAAAVPADRLVRLRQVHGADVVVARAGAPTQTGDIVISDDPALAIAVQVADCVPLLIADTRTGAVCAAHAGWRGMAARVPQVAVASLVAASGSRLRDLAVALGPSIGGCCYEVGDDVWQAMQGLASDAVNPSHWFSERPHGDAANPTLPRVRERRNDGRRYFDGWACVADQLVDAGVPAANIAVAKTCTASHPEFFCSYRRDGAPAGRLAAVIRAGRVNVPRRSDA